MTRLSAHPAAETLLAFASDGLAPSERDQITAHVAECVDCARGARAFAEIGRVARDETPPPFAMARARHRLIEALVEERHATLSMWRPRTVMVAMIVASLSGAAIAAVSAAKLGFSFGGDDDPVRSRRSSTSASERAEPADTASPSVPSSTVPASADVEPTPTDDSARAASHATDVARALDAAIVDGDKALVAPVRIDRAPSRASSRETRSETKSRRVALAPGARSSSEALSSLQRDLAHAASGDARFVDVGDLAAMAGDPRAARDAYVRALAGERGAVADQRLDRLVADGTLSEEDVLRAIASDPAAQESAEGMKRRCTTELRHRGDRAAVALCQRFGEQYPTHPAVRRLALAAGRTAEFRLDDPTLAVLEYSRAILVSEVAGVASTEALLARARAQAKLGATSAARADLGLYLHVHPEARFRDEVRALAALIAFDLEAATR